MWNPNSRETLGKRAVSTRCLRLRFKCLLVVTATSMSGAALFAACGTGEILEGTNATGQSLVGDDGKVIERSSDAVVAPGGALAPNRVIQGGTAVAACDPSVQGFGGTPLRRLTNVEFDNTVRDVFGIDPTPKISADFPRDGFAGPFASNEKGQVTDQYLNRYQQAAERLGKEVASKVETLVTCSAGDDQCAERFIQEIGKKAYRRPLDAQAVSALMTVFTAGKAGATFREGIEYVVQAMVMSPNFMYHVEAKAPSSQPFVGLPAPELAERLSYFIWGSIPDDALFAAVAAGKLDTAEGLRAEATRMMGDPRASKQIEFFADQWLRLHEATDQVLDMVPRYMDFSPEYAQALVNEAKHFVGYTLGPKGDGTFETLMTSNKSFPEGLGFKAYNMTAPAGYDGSSPIEIPGRRAGLITMPAAMSAHSSRSTSPIKRGVFVLNDVLCKKIELPENANVKAPEFVQGRSIRQGLEDVTKMEACAGCHAKINPIGFSLEGYDRMGRERDKDEYDAPVDDKGILMIGDPTVDGPIQGGPALSEKIFKSDSGRNCMIQQVFRFALGRSEAPADTCSFVSMAKRFEQSGFNVRQLIIDMVTEDSFRLRPGSAAPAEPTRPTP